jgi:GxxExxY protein
MIVGDAVIVELKAVEELHPIHQVQLMTYLKLTGCRLGLLINFNVKSLKFGIKRIVR